MGYPVFYTDASMFFVGGNGDKSGRTAYAGGCTKEWWDGECPNGTAAEKSATMGKLMADGGPKIDEANCAYTSSNQRITKAGGFADAEAGMVAYVIETPDSDVNLETMRYRITDVDAGGDWIEIGDATGADATVTVRVGGAFDSLQNALDATDAADHSVYIYTNLDETLSGSVDVDAGGGTTLQNAFKRVIGFKTVPGDLDRGGSLYQSALAILQAGSVDTGKCVTLDANGGAFEVLNIAVDNVVFENLHLYNTANSKWAVVFAGLPKGVVFRNCRAVDTEGVYNTAASVVFADSCYSQVRVHHYNCRGYGHVILNCVGKMGSSSTAIYVAAIGVGGTASAHVEGCICVASTDCGDAPLRVVGPPCSLVAINNTFYGFGGEGCQLNSGDFIIAYNNVFVMLPGGYGVQCLTWSSGAGSLQENHNCWYTTDGSALTFVKNDAGISEPPVVGDASVEVDPDFVDEGNADFRVRNPVVLRGGVPDAEGNADQMGAIRQQYRFVARGRAMNPARLGTVR